jgi:hypothetical protein
MKKFFVTMAIAACLIQYAEAQQLQTPAPSPTTTVKQDFALSSVEINYSRPAARGRKIFGDLVPYGKVWRTGANSATTITFGDAVTFGDKTVPAGKYGLLSIPESGSWTIILTKQLDVTSAAAYKQDQDVARITVQSGRMPITIENFMIVFDNITPNSMQMNLVWENTGVSIPISANIEDKIMAQINDLMNKDNRPYFQSAMYYMENGKDLNKALGWFDKAIEQNPSAFWVQHQKANCLAKMGRKQDAIAAANKSIELAKVAKNDDYVALNQKLIASLK